MPFTLLYVNSSLKDDAWGALTIIRGHYWGHRLPEGARMIRFLLVLLAFVSALLAFIFQETALFVASGLLLLVSVVLLLLQVREQFRKKNRLKLPTELTPDDELKARGILDVRPKSATAPETSLQESGRADIPDDAPGKTVVAEGIEFAPDELKSDYLPPATLDEEESPADDTPTEEVSTPEVSGTSGATKEELLAAGIVDIRPKASRQQTLFEEPVDESKPAPSRRRRVEVDAHLPALHNSIGAHTTCLIDVDTVTGVYRLRSVVSNGAVDDAGTEYPFAGFFLSDLLAQTTVVEVGGKSGIDIATMGVIRDGAKIRRVVASPVMLDEMPAAFFVAAFETEVDNGCKKAVTRAAEFFSSLYNLLADAPPLDDSPLESARRNPQPLRLVKSSPKSVQRRIIAEEISRARGKARPLALALVCLDSSSEISKTDESTIHEVEAWMRDCLEEVTPDGRVEYFGELGYGILQTRDVTDVEGWVKRAQTAFASRNGPVNAFPVVGVAMLSDEHTGPDDLQADAFRALRAAYECGDSTILVG